MAASEPGMRAPDGAYASAHLQRIRLMAAAVGDQAHIDELAQVAIETTGAFLDADQVGISIWDDDDRALRHIREGPRVLFGKRVYSPHQGVSGRAFRECRTVVEVDYPRSVKPIAHVVRGGVKSIAATPVMAGTRAVGVVTVCSLRHREFSDTDLALLAQIAEELAPALSIARHLELQERLNTELRVISDISRATFTSASAEELFRMAVAEVRRVLTSDLAIVLEMTPAAGEMVVRAEAGWPKGSLGVRLPVADPRLGGLVFIKNRKPVTFQDVRRIRKFVPHPFFLQHGVRSGALQPILAGDRVRWLLGAHCRSPRRFSRSELRFLETVARVVGESALRLEANAALAASQARLSAMLDHVPAVILGIERGGGVFFVDGRPVRESRAGLGKTDPAIDFATELYRNPDFMAAAERALDSHLVDFSHHVEATGRDWETRFSRIDDRDPAAGVFAVCIDVTERNQGEIARRESVAKSHFLASVSHELRTPLHSILGFAQLLESSAAAGLDAKQARYVSHIKASGGHLLVLINDLLDLSRISAGRLSLEVSPVAVADAVREVEASLRPQADAEGVALRASTQSRAKVLADPVRLRQILLNLVSNAIKFTPAPGVVEIRVRRQGGRVVVDVTDTGPGVPPDMLEAIFDEFVQLKVARPKPEQGSGLGLAVSRQLARAMRGDLTVQSRLGKGATFTLALPAADRLGSEARDEHGDDSSEEYAVEGAGTADRGDRGAHVRDLSEVH